MLLRQWAAGSLLLTCLVGFITGISVGAGVVVAQYYGAKDYKNLQDSVHTAMSLAGIGGIVLTIAGLLLSPFILQWLRVPQEIFEPLRQLYSYLLYQYTANGSLQHGKCDFKSIW